MGEETTAGAQWISDEEWSVLKDVIVSRYQKSTLEETMEYMAKEHNFRPTKPQYVHRLGKIWKVSKYQKRLPVKQKTSNRVSGLPTTKTLMTSERVRDTSTTRLPSLFDGGSTPSVERSFTTTAKNLHQSQTCKEPGSGPSRIGPPSHIMIPDDQILDEIFQPFHSTGNLSAVTPSAPLRPTVDSDSDSLVSISDGKRADNSDKTTRPISCPFRKRNPYRFNVRDHPSCAAFGFSDLTVLKSHVIRTHSQELLCQRCRTLLPTREALDAHARLPPEQMCQVPPGPRVNNYEDGITIERAWRLSSPFASSSVTTWRGLWQVLFPDDIEIPSPDYSPVIESYEVQRTTGADIDSMLLTIRNRVAALPTDANKAEIMACVEDSMLGFQSSDPTKTNAESSKTDRSEQAPTMVTLTSMEGTRIP
ncbi:hypothetical protein QBC40DRAFT_211661 [Triangularia verruculosa]|uniref:Clr5 domain-containing protein n=1 Tax=Triangularia verruculosa TaxID=2587418 RepID=A0AAN7ANJ1_9PEZI|nr:hypothetical protein QBC40DRAFT_211661 [Triangularia verruculosa]